ncbi:tetratricopeptide repeat protein 23-like [Saccoglossus kowalevskii]
MADYYSSFSEEDEDLKIADLGMPIVDIPTATEENGHETRRLHESTDEFTSDEEEMTSTRNKLTGKRKKHQKPNMTPPEVQLESTEKRAKKYMKKKHVDRAMVNLIQCVALSRIVYGDGHWRLAESHANLAHGYLLLRDLPNQAYHHADIAKAILLSGVHTSNSADEKSALLYVLIKVYYVLGRSLTMQKKFTEAEQNLQKAEKISDERSRLPGIDEYEQADINIKISIALGKVCISQSKTAFGTSCFEKAIKLIQRNYGKDNVELIPVYQDLGRISFLCMLIYARCGIFGWCSLVDI